MTTKDTNPEDDANPLKSAPNGGRDSKGRFLKGVWPGGPGRPRKVILIEAVRKYADAEGKDLDLSTYEIMCKIESLAKAGDVVAARLWIEQLCTQEAKEHILQHMGPAVPTGKALNDWINRLVEVSADDGGDGNPHRN